MRETFVIGDIHGHRDTLRGLLRDAGLIGPDDAWRAGASHLWFMGDLVDHGHEGLAVIDLVRQVQRQAAGAGGFVACLIGNHDVLLLAARRFGTAPSSGKGGTFLAEWRNNGGDPDDLRHLTPAQTAWLAALPAMARVGDDLLVHADAIFYERYGQTIGEVNRALAELLCGDDPERWNRLLAEFGEHHAFLDGEAGTARARAFLHAFGGTRIIHGHSPICSITGEPAADVRAPMVYAGGLCVDVDGGIYLGGPGFVSRLPAADD